MSSFPSWAEGVSSLIGYQNAADWVGSGIRVTQITLRVESKNAESSDHPSGAITKSRVHALKELQAVVSCRVIHIGESSVVAPDGCPRNVREPVGYPSVLAL
jgi:hypothetical protein